MVRRLLALSSAVGQKENVDDFRDPSYRTADPGRQARRAARLCLRALHLQELRVLISIDQRKCPGSPGHFCMDANDRFRPIAVIRLNAERMTFAFVRYVFVGTIRVRHSFYLPQRREGETEMVTLLNRRKITALAGIAASLLFVGPAALAQDSQIIVQAPQKDVRGERVSYYDLNLATPIGERTLERRVGGAVERVCLYDEGRWYGLAVPDYTNCAERAWRGARPQITGAVYRARLAAYGRRN